MKTIKLTAVALTSALLLASCSSAPVEAPAQESEQEEDVEETTEETTTEETTEETTTESPAAAYPDTFDGLVDYMVESDAMSDWIAEINAEEDNDTDILCWYYDPVSQSVLDTQYADEPGIINCTEVMAYPGPRSDREGSALLFYLYEIDPDNLEIYDDGAGEYAMITWNNIARDWDNIDMSDASISPVDALGYVFDDDGNPIVDNTVDDFYVTFTAINGNYAITVMVITYNPIWDMMGDMAYQNDGTSAQADQIVDTFMEFGA